MLLSDRKPSTIEMTQMGAVVGAECSGRSKLLIVHVGFNKLRYAIAGMLMEMGVSVGEELRRKYVHLLEISHKNTEMTQTIDHCARLCRLGSRPSRNLQQHRVFHQHLHHTARHHHRGTTDNTALHFSATGVNY